MAASAMDNSALQSLLLPEERAPRHSVSSELLTFVELAAPVVLTEMCIYLPVPITLSLTGQLLGEDAVTGAALGLLVGNLLGKAVVYGSLTAMETLAPQALGAGAKREVGLIAQRAYVCALAVLMPVMLLWLDGESVLLAVGQPQSSSRLAGRFLRVMPFAMPSVILFEVLRRFLFAQQVVWPVLPISICVLIVYYPISVVLLQRLGFDGVAWSLVFLYTALAVSMLLLVCVYRLPEPDTWPGLRREAFAANKMCEYGRLMLPGIVMLSEWWYFEVIVLIAGTLGKDALAAHAVAYTIIPLCFMFALGINIAACVRIGNAMGDNQPGFAKRLATMAFCVAAVSSVTCALVVFMAEDFFVAAFNLPSSAAARCHQIWPYVALFVFLDGLQGCMQGIVKGLGLQRLGSVCMIGTMWFIGVPATWAVANHSMDQSSGFVSLWRLQPLVYMLLVSLLVFVCWLSDWPALAHEVAKRSLGAGAE